MDKQFSYENFFSKSSLEVEIPQDILNLISKKDLISELTPSYASKGNEIIASSGGIFYPRENPDADDFVEEGQYV